MSTYCPNGNLKGLKYAQMKNIPLLALMMTILLTGCASHGGGSPSAEPAKPPAGTADNPSQVPPNDQPQAAPTPVTPAPATQTQTTASPAPASAQTAAPKADTAPPVDHVVVVIEENHSYDQIVGSKQAPYFNELIASGALLTNSHAVTHPSQPNYLALFSGSTQGITDDSCGKTYKTANLASSLIENKLTFIGYSEDLPKPGYTGCSSKGYARKHNPWIQFTNVPADLNQPFTAFPQDYSKLPTVSFVVPNHQNDMHDGTIGQADAWLKENLGSYVTWAKNHRSLLIVTWDEDDNSKSNRIPTLFVGPMIKQGKYDKNVNHYNVLRTIEDLYRVSPIGLSDKAESLSFIWNK